MKMKFECFLDSAALRSVQNHLGKSVTCQHQVQFEKIEHSSLDNIVSHFKSIEKDSEAYLNHCVSELAIFLLEDLPKNIQDFFLFKFLKHQNMLTDKRNICSLLFRTANGQYQFFSIALFGRLLHEEEQMILTKLIEPELIEMIDQLLVDDINNFNLSHEGFAKIISSEQIDPILVQTLGVRNLKLPTFKEDITFMDLSGHNLCKKSVDDLKTIFSSIPQTIGFLDLRSNLRMTQRSSVCVSHSGSNHKGKYINQFIQALPAIPPQVVWIDLSDNGIPQSEWKKILVLLPETVKYVLMADDVLMDLVKYQQIISHRNTVILGRGHSSSELNNIKSITDISDIVQLRESKDEKATSRILI